MRVTKELRGQGDSQKTYWRVVYWAAGKRHRRAFSSRLDAENWAKINRHAPQRMGSELFEKWESVPDRERHQILQARELLQKIGNGLSWVELIQTGISRQSQENTVHAVAYMDAAAEFLAQKKSNSDRKVSDQYLSILSYYIGKVGCTFNEVPLSKITSQEIKTWLDQQQKWSPETYNNYRGMLYSLFEWAVQKKYALENPIQTIPKRRRPEFDFSVISPTDLKALFQASANHPEWGMTAYFALGFGFGIREAEICRLDWSEVSLAEKIVLIPAVKAKTKTKRVIRMENPALDSFAQFLSPASESGPIVPANHVYYRDKLCLEAKVAWTRNMMRKSFASYHFARTQNDALTRAIMGHEEDSSIFQRNYRSVMVQEKGNRRIMTASDIDAYWTICPLEKVDSPLSPSDQLPR